METLNMVAMETLKNAKVHTQRLGTMISQRI
jgi:hypothetical protein